jgi:hypothetical protein
VKVTIPAKPLIGVMVMVDVPFLVARIAVGVTALAEIVKSGPGTVTSTFTVRDRALGAVPVVPVTMTVNPLLGSGLHETDRTAPLNDAVQPAGIVPPAVKVTAPAKPLTGVTDMVEVPEGLAVVRAIVDGFGIIEKS